MTSDPKTKRAHNSKPYKLHEYRHRVFANKFTSTKIFVMETKERKRRKTLLAIYASYARLPIQTPAGSLRAATGSLDTGCFDLETEEDLEQTYYIQLVSFGAQRPYVMAVKKEEDDVASSPRPVSRKGKIRAKQKLSILQPKSESPVTSCLPARRQENFPLQSKLSVLTLILCSVHPNVTAVARKI